MYATQASLSWWTWLLHVVMVLIGGYMIANLALAVIFINFTKHYMRAKTTLSTSRGELQKFLCLHSFPCMSDDESSKLSSDSFASFSARTSMANSNGEEDDDFFHGKNTAIDDTIQSAHPASSFLHRLAFYGHLSRAWEVYRDLCYFVQDSQAFKLRSGHQVYRPTTRLCHTVCVTLA